MLKKMLLQVGEAALGGADGYSSGISPQAFLSPSLTDAI